MKKFIVSVVFASAFLLGADSRAAALADAPVKVGIKPSEIKAAQDLAFRILDPELYRLLGGKEAKFPAVAIPATQQEINTIFWPALVWAIEEGNVDLANKLVLYTGAESKKPYGKFRPTPRQIAQYHGQKKVDQMLKNLIALKGHVIQDVVGVPLFQKSQEQQIEEDPWNWLALAIEKGNLKLVEYIMEKKKYIKAGDRRNAQGLGSHDKTALEIALHNRKKSKAAGENELAQKQAAIIEYLVNLD